MSFLRQLAEDIRAHAEYTDKLADAVEESEAPEIHVMKGNIYNALEGIRNFFKTQVINKVASAKTSDPRRDHQILGQLYIALGELEGKMAGKKDDES